jgi:glyoxylase-like metal-dependent hydrolase (beta-lactamase superfamily II)
VIATLSGHGFYTQEIKAITMTEARSNKPGSNVFSVATGVWGVKELFVNYYFIQDDNQSWALVDAGLKWSAKKIMNVAESLFGKNNPPVAILLTHGHFDHTGAVATLAAHWNVPVYAHVMELPFLTGISAYPPADPTVLGGFMSAISWMFPKGPIDISEHIRPLPEDNSVPGLPDWKFIHTPGHSPGHVSFFRERDKALLSGDAFVTTKTESALSSLSYKKELSGPPQYFTCNWASAKISVLKLAALGPEIVAAGHGFPMFGDEMRNALNLLGSRFAQLAEPAHGRYVNQPAVSDENGVQYIPPAKVKTETIVTAVGVTLAVAAIGFILFQRSRKKESNDNMPSLTSALRSSYKVFSNGHPSKRFRTLDRAFSKT